MLRTFRGEYEQKIDGKGRVSIPSTFRKVIESRDPEWSPGEDRAANLILVYGDDRRAYLEGYSVEAMAEVDARVQAMKGGPRKTYLTKFFSRYSMETSVDSTGRLVLPKKLRDKLGLPAEGGMLVFAGSNTTFQIWHPDAYEADKGSDDEAALAGLEPGIDPLALLDMED